MVHKNTLIRQSALRQFRVPLLYLYEIFSPDLIVYRSQN